jgi:Transmembrane secretion effector
VRGRLAPLGVWPFGRLLSSYTLNELGDSVGLVALSLYVFGRSDSVPATALFFLVAKFLPALIAPALTARVDQVALRRSLPSLYVVEALAFGGLALSARGTFFLPLVLALGFVDGVVAITARGLTRGAVGAVLEPAGMLRDGNALMNLGFAISAVGGTALGGVLVSAFGLSTALLADAVSFVVIAAVLGTTSGLPSGREGEKEPWRDRLRAGLEFARGHRLVRLLLMGEALAFVFFTLTVPIEVVYAKDSLGTTDTGFGILLAAWGAGIVVGSVVYIGIKQRSAALLVAVSTAAVGVSYLGMAVSHTLLLACLFAMLGGAGNGIQWISVMTALQEATPPDFQARVTGLLESIGAAVPGIGYLIGGALATIGSPRTAYAVAGGGVLVIVVAAVALGNRLLGQPLAPDVRSRPGEVPLPDPFGTPSQLEHERP